MVGSVTVYRQTGVGGAESLHLDPQATGDCVAGCGLNTYETSKPPPQ